MSGLRCSSCMSSAVVAVIVLSVLSCGKVSGPPDKQKTGELEVQVQVKSALGKKMSRLKTEFDSLVIEVEADDLQPMRFSRAIGTDQVLIIDTVSRIPAGSGREITVSTINRNGETVHVDSFGVRTVRIDPNFTTLIQVVLIPVKGSIYLQIAGVPTDIDSMSAVFTSSGGQTWVATVARSPKIYLSIDDIPDRTAGTLAVAGFTTGGDTLYRATTDLQVNARATNSVQLSFEATPGGLALSGTIELPGAVTVSGAMNGVTVAESERGDLIITEIMYAANDSEYIEVYNPAASEVTYDSLYLEIDGTKRLFAGVTVAAGGFYVFGRKMLPWVDAAHATASALDLSGSGNWITVLTKEMTVLDQVVYAGGTNNLEWPKVSGKKSICLRNELCSAEANNFGRNWFVATETIEGVSQSGTPHAL
jgi:hypothetical protein